MADVNGDGLSDLLQVNRFNVLLWLNQAGIGFKPQTLISNTPEFITGETTLRLADINGDGATDLLYATYPANPDSIYRYLDFTGGTLPNLLTTIDNGLGRIIILSYRPSTDYYVDEWNAGQQWTQRSPVPVTVVSRSTVTDRHSGQVYVSDYSYRNAWYDGKEKSFRGFAIAQETNYGDATSPTRVVQMIFDTGKERESRKGLLLQQDITSEGGSCGSNGGSVALMAATAEASELLDVRAATISPAVVEATSPINCYSRSLNLLETRTLASGSDGRDSSFSYIRQSDLFAFENTSNPRRTQQRFNYDTVGNQTELFEYGEVALDGSNPKLGNDERLTYRSFATNLDGWIVDKPSSERNTDLKGATVSEQRFYYDGPAFVGLPAGQVTQGNLSRVESNTGPAAANHWVQTQRLAYDRYGNVVGRMDPNGQVGADDHWTEVVFDVDFHAFPTQEIIHLGEGQSLTMQADYDLGLGVITRAIDFNGHAIHFQYDGLARLTAIVRPGDTLALPTQRFSYHLHASLSSVSSESREQSGTENVYRTVSYVDGLGRTLQTRSEGENGQVIIIDAVSFNLRGDVQKKFLPTFAITPTFDYLPLDGTASSISFRYDALQRPLQMTNPDGTITRTHFLPLETVLYDEEDNRTGSANFNTPSTLRSDGRGRLIQVLEHNGNAIYTTTYAYDTLDNLTVITDTLGNIKRQGFDWLKRKLWIDDPNGGLRTYRYDDVGNLFEYVDAKDQRIRYSYDGVNRLVAENFILSANDTTADVRYYYDNALAAEYPNSTNTQGRLSWIDDPSGREYLSYDARGNVVGKIKRIYSPGQSQPLDFVLHIEYDALDRPIALTYPDGTKIGYQYNAQSLLECIPGFLNNLDYLASGQRALAASSDGISTLYRYDSRLRLDFLRSQTGNGTALQDWHYHFDASNNITQIDDLRPDRTPADDDSRRFTLDPLYRLTSVNYLTGEEGYINYAYDPIGNLVRKSASFASENLGEMRYGQGAGPHALTQVGNATWRYDKNGNLLEKPGFSFTWDMRDRLVAVDAPNALRQEHSYDYAGERVVKVVKHAQGSESTLYPDRAVEVRNGQLVKSVFAGDTRVAEVRTPFQPSQLIRGFAPPSNSTQIEVATHTDEQLTNRIYLPLISNTADPAFVGETVFYHTDHLGSASLVVNAQGQVLERVSYFPYGTERLRSGESPVAYRFTGQEQDRDIGLYDYGARFYDPVVGRFVSVDPLYVRDTEMGLKNPQKLNLFL